MVDYILTKDVKTLAKYSRVSLKRKRMRKKFAKNPYNYLPPLIKFRLAMIGFVAKSIPRSLMLPLIETMDGAPKGKLYFINNNNNDRNNCNTQTN